ncbi:MAG TPA: DUF5343 domain-containing protein [Caulobacteraceae bacterium]
MPVTQDRPAPYAPTSAILGIVGRHRDKGLPTPISGDVLARAGILPSLIPRTLSALQGLDLIDADGKPTDVLEGLRLAPEAEYSSRLAEWLKGAYADALQWLDPTTGDETAVRAAFRNYTPHGQQGRMVTLFMGLFKAAGVTPDKASGGAAPREKVDRAATPKLRAQTKAKQNGAAAAKVVKLDGVFPPALAGLLASLPTRGQAWTQAQRDTFVTTFGVVLDFCFPPGVVASPKVQAERENGRDA